MNVPIRFPGDSRIGIDTEHGSLSGLLSLPQPIAALVVLARAGAALDGRDEALAAALPSAQFGTLILDLLTRSEERFADVPHNLPLLVKRMLDVLKRLKQGMALGELPNLRFGLYAAGDCSAAALRVAAVRDEDVFAVVCRDGLIDLAGMVYLRSLISPLLVLSTVEDERLLASNRRALRELRCRNDLRVLPTNSPEAGEFVLGAALPWFVRNRPACAVADGNSPENERDRSGTRPPTEMC